MLTVADAASSGLDSQLTRTILVVEDEEPIRIFLIEFLQDSGYNVLQAGNVAEAKDLLSTYEPVDLVFSDVNMPGDETGFMLAKWVHRHYPGTKILLTSGFPHVKEDTRDLPEPLIPKPYSCCSVLRRIQRLI